MKKLISLFLLIVMIIFTACNDYNLDDKPPYPPKTESEPSDNISQEEAVAMAEEIAADINPSGYSRSASRKVDRTNISVVSVPNSRSGSNDTLIYLINYTYNQGFAAISAIKCESPILAVIDDSNYQTVKDANNPGFNMFMNMAIEYVLHENENNKKTISRGFEKNDDIVPLQQFKTEVDTTYKSIQAPKLGNMSWGQTGIEGSLCPNKIAGCAPVAISMILSYYKTPSWIGYTYPNADIEGEDINWDLINKHLPNSKGECYNCYYQIHNSIARVLREIGHRTDTEYKENSSSTANSNTKKILQKYLPTKQVGGYSDYNVSGVENAITNGLALISGRRGAYTQSEFKENGHGHAWVADGYRFVTRNIRYYEKGVNEVLWHLKKTETHTERLLHFNWGWNGSGNGYFSGPVFSVILNIENTNTGKTEQEHRYYSNAKYLSIQ